MATPTTRRRSFQRTSRAQSILSDSPFTTPRPTPPPPPTRFGRGVRGVRANSIVSDAPSPSINETTTEKGAQKAKPQLPAHYFLPPTHPSPFTGTLEASLDAIQEWARVNALSNNGTPSCGLQPIVDTLLRPVDSTTNWPALLKSLQSNDPGWPRYLTEELLFLTTRTLLPEQIVENRALMARLYNAKKQLAMRLVLRYDMLREWKMEPGAHHRDQAITVASVPPPPPPAYIPVDPPKEENKANDKKGKFPFRRPCLLNVVATLIAAPTGGFTTHGVRERMKHHVTDLDAYLVLGDEEVAGWSERTLLNKLSQVLLHWQWLRRNNEALSEMEVSGWGDLGGRADECGWIAEDVKRNAGGGGGKKAVIREED